MTLFLRRTLALPLTLALFACAHSKPSGSESGGATVADESGSTSLQGVIKQSEASPVFPEIKADEVTSPPPSEWVVLGVKLEKTDFDYPVTINPKVEEWVEYFTGRGRKHFERYLARSEYFIPYIIPILKKNNLPTDLVYLAMIESGFHNHARSFAAAVGPWQFISATGKRYGLRVDWWIDERRDIEQSSIAAGRYLKDLHQMFQSWELAAAAYNAGEAKIARAIKMYGTRNFWKLSISKRRYLRPETKNYVPKIMAAAIVAKNRSLFGFPERYNAVPTSPAEDEDEPLSTLVLENDDTSTENGETVASADEKEGEELSTLLEGEESADEAQAASWVVANEGGESDSFHAPHVSKSGELGFKELIEFEIEGPADLLRIAEAAGLSYSDVKSMNPSILRWCTPPNQKTFRIKLPKSVKDRFLTTYNHPSFQRATRFQTYKVRRGDNINTIAKRFRIKPQAIKDLNRDLISDGMYVGAEVVLPMPTDKTRTYASLDLYDPPERKRRRYRRGFAHRRIKKKRAGAQAFKTPFAQKEIVDDRAVD